jgi:ubiquinone/menaquinone biosynthesis C-methylase UbiE
MSFGGGMLCAMVDQAARIRSYFDAAAGEYARARASEYSFCEQRRIALKLLPARLGRVLDAGCGTADIAESLLERADEYRGFDLSAQMIAHGAARLAARGFSTRCHLEVGNAEALSYEDHSFDAIVSLGMLEYLLGYERALGEMWRVLRPGGVVVLAVPSRASLYHRAQSATAAVRRTVKRILGRPPRRSETFFTSRCVPAQLDEELKRAGFEKFGARYCNFIFHPLHELHAGMSLAINRRLSALEHVPFAHRLGTQYIVAALKPA